MKESIGYTVSLNIVITFIIIVFAFLSAALIYFKSNKVSNVITSTIEKYEGYNDYAATEIQAKLSSIGYNRKPVNCREHYEKLDYKLRQNESVGSSANLYNGECYYNDSRSFVDGTDGYCVFYCEEKLCVDEKDKECSNSEDYYFYKITTNMMINIPIVNDILDIPIFSNTNRLYDFEKN